MEEKAKIDAELQRQKEFKDELQKTFDLLQKYLTIALKAKTSNEIELIRGMLLALCGSFNDISKKDENIPFYMIVDVMPKQVTVKFNSEFSNGNISHSVSIHDIQDQNGKSTMPPWLLRRLLTQTADGSFMRETEESMNQSRQRKFAELMDKAKNTESENSQQI